VTAVGREWQVAIEGQGTRRADALVLACPAYAQARLLGDRDPALTTALSAIPYNRIAVVAVGFAKKDVPGDYDGFGYIAPQRTRRDLLGVQWCSAIFPERAPPGMVLWRALCGGWHRTDVMDWSDDRLVEAVCSEMRLACGVRAAPMFREVVRWDRAIPQYQIGHADRVATIEARTATQPGLFLTGNSFRGVAINDCCEDAEKVAGAVAAYLGGRAEE
jgi:oxygen-dependent protoporphyrinogen oxidase